MASPINSGRAPERRATAGRWAAVLALFLVSGLAASLVGWWAYRTDARVYYRVEELRAQVYDVLNPRPNILPTVAVAQSFPTPAVRPPTEAGSAIQPDLPSATPTGSAAAALTVPPAASANADPTETQAALPSATPAASPTPLPAQVALADFRHEYQKFNNCGPASLAVDLSYWGWQGSQDDTAKVLKPNQDDKNVSPIEIYDYLTTIGYDAYIRVDGNLDTLKRFIAAGYPVLVEKGFWCEPGEKRCNDWFGHYSVFTGYDDAKQIFVMQDTFRGPNLKMRYADVLQNWRAFNFLYIVVFPAGPEHDARVQALLGAAADLEQNYRDALHHAQQEALTLSGEDAAFAWFNVGTNLHYLRDYAGAAQAYDQARQVGLPYRMLWYQFGPYRAYYYMARYQDVIDLATFAIESTPKPGLEEAFYWRGLAYEAVGQPDKAVEDYRAALVENPSDALAQEALARLGAVP